MSDNRSPDPQKSAEPDLIPPDSVPAEESGTKNTDISLFPLLALILLLAGTGFVVFLLPGGSEKNVVISSVTADSSVKVVEVEDQINSPEQGRDESEKLLETLLSLEVRAGVENAPKWGGKKYQAVLDARKRGDAALGRGSYADASADYQSAISGLEQLLDSREEVFQTAMAEGNQALTEGDSIKSAEQFAIALAINPASNEARKGAGRAASLVKVTAMFREAEELWQSGDLPGAGDKFVQLLALDGDFQAGRESLDRLQQELDERKFQEGMSDFYRAVNAGRLTEAASSLKLLKALHGGDEQVSVAARILAEREISAKINSLRQKAETLSKEEKWQEALSVYKNILSIAPDALAGINGRMQAARRLKLDERLKDALNRPDLLQDEAQRSATARLVDYARQVEPKGPVLTSQIEKLNELISIAATPVPINLKSDNSTDIVIYHVGRMGRFFSRKINLTPGTYTLVGTRMGFRDVRKIIKIVPGELELNVSLRCEEPI